MPASTPDGVSGPESKADAKQQQSRTTTQPSADGQSLSVYNTLMPGTVELGSQTQVPGVSSTAHALPHKTSNTSSTSTSSTLEALCCDGNYQSTVRNHPNAKKARRDEAVHLVRLS
jgi:hypothetical protein